MDYNKTYKVKRGFYEMDEDQKDDEVKEEEKEVKEEFNSEEKLKKEEDIETEEEKVDERPGSEEDNLDEIKEVETDEKKVDGQQHSEEKEELGEESVPEENKEEKVKENSDESAEEIGKSSKEEFKQVKNLFLVIGFLVIIFLGVFIFINSVKHFNYDGLDFNVIQEGELIFYQTTVPHTIIGKITGKVVNNDYNFYFRNDPRKLRSVAFDGELNLKKKWVLDFEEEFNCDGDGIIAVANLVSLLDLMGVESMKDETAGCDPDGRYTFLRLQPGDETSIEQFGPSCYNLNINDCEILEATEKYMIEIISMATKNLG